MRKIYLQGNTDVCVKIAVLEICLEKKPKETAAESFKNISTVGFHC